MQRYKLSDEKINEAVDAYAPLGLKKKFFVIDSNTNVELDDRGLPPVRLVQSADISNRLDSLGGYLIEKGYPLGALPKDKVVGIMNESVKYLFDSFERLIATLSPSGLLAELVNYNERLIQATALRRLTIPTQLACFEDLDKVQKEIAKSVPEYSETSVASRFIIEYVAARPPTGRRPFSLSVYDELIAPSKLITSYGLESDLCNFELVDYDVGLLESGRLGIDRKSFESAREKFFFGFSEEEVERSTLAFRRQVGPSSNEHKSKHNYIDQIDIGFIAEFDISLTDLSLLFGEIIAIGYEISVGAATIEKQLLIERVQDGLGWDALKIEKALNLLLLVPRDDFLLPPPPYVSAEVFPWRFNREMAYLRKPLLLVNSGVETIIWGPRNIHSAFKYLINLTLDGRLKARSKELSTQLGKIVQAAGQEFNDKVGSFFETQNSFAVRMRVGKFGALRMLGPKGPLGDIDVLAFSTSERTLLLIECKDVY
ncbi:MAG: hypothetical protein EOP06_17510, partial [Proteobacteria bacterium]